jgi:hypothetical protein
MQKTRLFSEKFLVIFRDFELGRNEEFRKIWIEEEGRIKKISTESRNRLEDVRNRMLNGLERVDAANQEMLVVMQEMVSIDNEIRSLTNKL